MSVIRGTTWSVQNGMKAEPTMPGLVAHATTDAAARAAEREFLGLEMGDGARAGILPVTRTRAHARRSALRRRHARCRHHRDGVGDRTAHRVGDDAVRRVGAARRAHRGRRRRAGARWPQLAGARAGIDVRRPDVHRARRDRRRAAGALRARVTSRCPRSPRRTTAHRCCHPRRAASTDISRSPTSVPPAWIATARPPALLIWASIPGSLRDACPR